MCYQVMIVEDDPMVAAINKKYTETVPGFRVAGIFRNGAEGLEYLRENHVDLVILDYYMPEMNGDVFMDRIREEGIQVSVIMVTSANSAEWGSLSVRRPAMVRCAVSPILVARKLARPRCRSSEYSSVIEEVGMQKDCSGTKGEIFQRWERSTQVMPKWQKKVRVSTLSLSTR